MLWSKWEVFWVSLKHCPPSFAQEQFDISLFSTFLWLESIRVLDGWVSSMIQQDSNDLQVATRCSVVQGCLSLTVSGVDI
ncbi:hypothetical protein E2C01_019473 [Portunus trituberculatus]|uniref:Uncharacterized protein n=1 Tax=Portunus trituberculatus TaxID=210409 RepID=A0A5B7DXZ9_PORTR|nr:hypothetical protein [Portunus trituberculatus]